MKRKPPATLCVKCCGTRAGGCFFAYFILKNLYICAKCNPCGKKHCVPQMEKRASDWKKLQKKREKLYNLVDENELWW